MRAVQVVGPGQAEFIETPRPELKPGHALIRTVRLSLCGSDHRMLHHAPRHLYPFPPGTTGHEMVGRVEEVDAPGSGIQAGQMVLALVDGHRAMAEYYLAPAEKVLPLPAGKPIEHLLQAQQLGTVIFACKHLSRIAGQTVAVIGQGSAGLWFNFMLRRAGARRIFAIDLQEHRLAVAGRYGATDTLHNANQNARERLSEMTDGRLVDLVVEAAGETEAIQLACQLVRQEGEILYFGVPQAERIEFDYETLFWKFPRIRTICKAQREPGQVSTRLALDIIAGGELDVAPVLTHRFPFDRVLEAYELQGTRDCGAIKIIVEMPD